MRRTPELTLRKAVEWRAPLWAEAARWTLATAEQLLPDEARILEIGYNSGMMACYLARTHRWTVTGYEVDRAKQALARSNALRYGVQDRTEFHVWKYNDVFSLRQRFDGVFMKSVLFHLKDKETYKKWLGTVHALLKDHGVLMAIENGRGNWMDRLWRKRIARYGWADNTLFDDEVEALFRAEFPSVALRCFGRASQYFTGLPLVCELIQRVESCLLAPSPAHCFVASVVATSAQAAKHKELGEVAIL